MTTLTLHMRGANGTRYVFRSVNKVPTDLVEEFEGTPIQAILQDQISSFHPSGAPVAARLLDAVGVLHTDPKYVVVPDDPRLAEFRGMLALFEERPDDGLDGTAGFAGSRQIVQLEELFDILEAEPESRVDVVDLLRARMVDLLVGDRDRSRNNHLWARIEDGDGSRWRVIPRDRDHAFVRFDGVLKALARAYEPRLVSFSDVYPNIAAATRNAWDIDRNLLVTVDRATWLSVVRDVQRLLTDEVIANAARQMPPEHFEIFGEELTRSLRLRRDHLPVAAQHLYEIVFGHADMHATDEAEQFTITRLPGGAVTLTFGAIDGSVTRFTRTFESDETSEIRLYMQGGDDLVVLSGPQSPILLRLIGGGGSDRFEGDGRGSIIYDRVEDSEYAEGLGARLEDRRAPRPYSWFNQVTLSPTVSFGDGGEKYFEIGPIYRYTSTDTATVDQSYIADTDPYGSGKFTQVGLRASFQVDTRDRVGTPGSGVFVAGGGNAYPQLFD